MYLGSKHIVLYRKFFRRLDFNWGEIKNVPEVHSVCHVISSLAAGVVGCEIMVPIPAESAFSSPILVLLLLIFFSFFGCSQSHEASQSRVSIEDWAVPYGCAVVNVERVIGQNIQGEKV